MVGSSLSFKSYYAACEYAIDSELLHTFHRSYHLLTCVCLLYAIVNLSTLNAVAVLYVTAGRSHVGCCSSAAGCKIFAGFSSRTIRHCVLSTMYGISVW